MIDVSVWEFPAYFAWYVFAKIVPRVPRHHGLSSADVQSFSRANEVYRQFL